MKLLSLVPALLLAAPAYLAAVAPPPAAADAIVGKWRTADQQGVVQIYQQQNRFFGKIAGPESDRLDSRNPDEKLRRRPLLGAVILHNFRFDGTGTWQDGTIYDPNSGKTYSCTLKLKNAGQQLEVRGYIGIALMGRTETWTRVR